MFPSTVVARVAAVAREAAQPPSHEPFGVDLIRRLLVLVPADRAGYFEYECVGDAPANLYEAEEPIFDFGWRIDPAIEAQWQTWPLHDFDLRPGAVHKLSDFLSAAFLRRNGWYADVMRPRAMRYELKFLLPAPNGIRRGFWWTRGADSRDFSEQERDVLSLLAPELAAIRVHWRDRRVPSQLSARELEVLRLVAEGAPNKVIAARLFISPTTVRTHLDNIYEKLDVHTRTAAVARAFGSSAGALPAR
jgi:DNA-binding CsgD family transcriptional regulator